ncbi:MAG: acetate uptake transporter [Candidatus Hermodarchaeota archaeon]
MSNQLANPAPLGLMGFGVTTVLLNLHNAGFYLLGPMILSMGIFYGGLAQIIAGLMEYKKGNSFGTLAFTSYGLFWLSLVFINLLPNTSLWALPSESSEVGTYLLMWGIFTLLMFFGTLKLNRALQVVFLTLTVLFFLLAIGDFTGIPIIGIIAGYEGILCGASAIYLSIAEILNEIYGRTILPIGSK